VKLRIGLGCLEEGSGLHETGRLASLVCDSHLALLPFTAVGLGRDPNLSFRIGAAACAKTDLDYCSPRTGVTCLATVAVA
jgi:hypothetical protein